MQNVIQVSGVQLAVCSDSQKRKPKRRLKCIVLVVVVFFSLFVLTGFKVSDSVSTPITPAVTESPETLPSALTPVSTSTGGNVFDANNRRLLFNPQTGRVYTDAGAVFDRGSQPVTHNPQAGTFTNSNGDNLSLVERAMGGVTGRTNFFLAFGNYTVRSVQMSDRLYLARLRANTPINRGAEREIFVMAEFVQAGWWARNFGGRAGYYYYFDLNGHQISHEHLVSAPRIRPSSGLGIIISRLVPMGVEHWGTVRGLLEYIEVAAEQSEDLAGFALNPQTGVPLRENRGNRIRIAETNQLKDIMHWPLVGADARPLWWDSANAVYRNHTGTALVIDEQNRLVDTGGFIAHSSMGNILDGAAIYFLYLADGSTLLPVTVRTVAGAEVFYDLNGVRVSLDEIVMPELFRPEQNRPNFWQSLFGSGGGGCADGSGCAGALGTVLMIFLIILAVIVVVLIVKFLKWVLT